jgi:hypothetical protein
MSLVQLGMPDALPEMDLRNLGARNFCPSIGRPNEYGQENLGVVASEKEADLDILQIKWSRS